MWLLFVLSLPVWGQGTVQDFTLTNVIDGKAITLSDAKTHVLVIFTSIDCAYDHYYLSRITDLISKYKGQLSILLINSNIEPQESQAEMKRYAAAHQLSAPFLADKDQSVMKQLGANKTPEAYLLRQDKGKFSVVYHGAIDDNPQVASDVSEAYLSMCIDKLLSGKKIERPSTRATGCVIRKR